MTPEQDKQGRRFQLGKLVARLEASGLLDKIDAKRPVTLAVYLGGSEKAALALRWRWQDREPNHLLEVLTIDTQDVARPLVRLATNDLDGLAAELLQAVSGLLTQPPHREEEQRARSACGCWAICAQARVNDSVPPLNQGERRGSQIRC